MRWGVPRTMGMAGADAEAQATSVGAVDDEVPETLQGGIQQVIDSGLELARMTTREIDIPGGAGIFHERFASWESLADRIADETRRGKAASGMAFIKRMTAQSVLPSGRWKPMVLAILKNLDVPHDTIESVRQYCRITEAKIAEAMGYCDNSRGEVANQTPSRTPIRPELGPSVQGLNSPEALDPEKSGQDSSPASGSIEEQLISAAKDILQLFVNVPGGVNAYRSHRESIVGIVKQVPDVTFREGLEKLLEYQRSKFKANTNSSWKPIFLCLLRRLGVPVADLVAFHLNSRAASDRYTESEEDLTALGLPPEVWHQAAVPQAGASAGAPSIGGTPTPADGAEAADRAATASGNSCEPAAAAPEAEHPVGAASGGDSVEPPPPDPVAAGASPTPAGSPDAAGGTNFAALPSRPNWRRPYKDKSANSYRFCFVTRDGNNRNCNVAIRQCDNNEAVAERIILALYKKALETDGDVTSVFALRDEMFNAKKKDSADGKRDGTDGAQEAKETITKEGKEETDGPPQKKQKREDKHKAEEPAAESQDAPPGHEAHGKVKYTNSNRSWVFYYGTERFQITERAAGGSGEECARIARLCYMKFEEGWTKEQVLVFRNEQCERFATPAHASPTEAGAEAEGKPPKKKRGKDALDLTKQEASEVKRLRATGREFEIVRMHGRETKKKNSSVNGLYVQTRDGFGGVKAYEKVGSTPRFLLYSAKRGRWLISDTVSDARQGFAYIEAKDGGTSGPTVRKPRGNRWFVFDGKDDGYKEDPAVQCTAINSSEVALEAKGAAKKGAKSKKQVKQEIKEEESEAKVKAEPAEPEDASAQEGEPNATQTSQSTLPAKGEDSSSSDDSESDDDSDSSSASGAKQESEQGRSPEQPLPQLVEVEQPAPAPPQPVLHTAQGRICAKMLVRTFFRCSCHFTYVDQCPEVLKARS